MALARVDAVTDVLKTGDLVDVKLLEINQRGQMKLSRRAVLELDGGIAPSVPAPPAPPPSPPTPPPPRREPRVVVTRRPKE
jgi:polyribonucleotide nucleotidyltransferase